jgi:DNA polymerase alpha subunit A
VHLLIFRIRIPAARGKRDFGFLIKQDITSGRLICDTQQSAQEFVHETNYTLKTLASLYLKESCEEILPADIPRYFSDTNSLLHLINVSLKDAFLSIKLMDKLLVLPLTKQLTSLCGNLWSHSLRSQRADRIEHLLLHEFHRRKFIVPEKYSKAELKAKGEKNEMIEGENAPEEEKTSRRKPQYSGGLVLEPKRGLYKDFVLLLDFNSLYPSIIQEYDICFTTRSTLPLPHEKDANYQAVDEQLVPVPNPTGVLPTVIRNLVQRRRDVKKVMEQTSDTFRKQQLDIKQKALKLVANAMYGCLGFANSRFHCKDLASLITQQGRSILSRTVELTERLGYEIIYGDTDSIMVNSKTRDLVQAREIANSIRGEVNKLYTKLEIGMDGIFKTLLLLKKKKYAALTVVEKNGLITAAKEVKGLDLVRRDWCVLSKELGQ